MVIIYIGRCLCYAGRTDCPFPRSIDHGASLMNHVVSLRHASLIAAAMLVATSALAADDTVLQLVARDGVFTPSVIEAPAGKRVRLEVSNEGKTAMEFESRDLKQEKVIPPGGKATLTINAMKPGEYRFFDEFHEKTGQGRFVVK
jgi:plastocyanin